ncbi:hypothetical protein M422DRAFT_81020, partial [Sphaerobolus stellatus SS14]
YICIDCDYDELCCTTCLVEDHGLLPLYCIKTWNGSYFEEGSLANISVVLSLGHNSSLC